MEKNRSPCNFHIFQEFVTAYLSNNHFLMFFSMRRFSNKIKCPGLFWPGQWNIAAEWLFSRPRLKCTALASAVPRADHAVAVFGGRHIDDGFACVVVDVVVDKHFGAGVIYRCRIRGGIRMRSAARSRLQNTKRSIDRRGRSDAHV